MLASYVVPLASGQTNDPSGSLVAVAEGLLVEVLLANTESVLETTEESVVGEAEEVLQLLEEAMVERTHSRRRPGDRFVNCIHDWCR